MSGETENSVSGWTADTLKEHLREIIDGNDLRYQQRFESQETNLGTAITAQEKAVAAALSAAERAVNKAEIAAEKRFDSVNEFRAQLSDQAASFLPRREFDVQHTAVIERIDALQRLADQGGARSEGRKDLWGYVVGAAGTLALIIGVITGLH